MNNIERVSDDQKVELLEWMRKINACTKTRSVAIVSMDVVGCWTAEIGNHIQDRIWNLLQVGGRSISHHRVPQKTDLFERSLVRIEEHFIYEERFMVVIHATEKQKSAFRELFGEKFKDNILFIC